jgi:hypothetical protein
MFGVFGFGDHAVNSGRTSSTCFHLPLYEQQESVQASHRFPLSSIPTAPADTRSSPFHFTKYNPGSNACTFLLFMFFASFKIVDVGMEQISISTISNNQEQL